MLTSNEVTSSILNILEDVTLSIANSKENKSEAFEVLKKGLAYCWNVAIVACPDKGKNLFEKWVGNKNKEIIWIVKENLRKKRLLKMDSEWVSNQMAKLSL